MELSGAFVNGDFFGLTTIAAASLVAAGVAGGLLAGLLGIGGGIVIVPVLYFITRGLGVDPQIAMHMSVATSLATIVLTGASSMLSHNKKGAVNRDLIKRWWWAVMAGAYSGSLLAASVDGVVLTGLFAVIALLVSLRMLFMPAGFAVAQNLPREPFKTFIGGIIGFLSAMIGVGGGTLTVPTLSILGWPIHKAVGTSSAVGFFLAVAASAGYLLTSHKAALMPAYSIGLVHVPSFICVISASVLCAPIGAKLAHNLNRTKLRRVFGVFLAITALRMLAGLMG